MARGIRTPDKTKELIFGLWRKANEPGNEAGVTLPCQDAGSAQRMRFMLYNTVKKARSGEEEVDDALLDAITNCSASLTGEGRTSVVIRKKLFTDAVKIMMEALGTATPGGNETEEAMLRESQQRMMRELEQFAEPAAEGDSAQAPAARQTPYYKR